MNDRLSVAFLEETNACFKTQNELTTDSLDLQAKLRARVPGASPAHHLLLTTPSSLRTSALCSVLPHCHTSTSHVI